MIFTSTPQGLEPGRTGFCTVARHRDLRSRLVRELERISVYEFNLEPNAEKAKINSFRRFELGTEEFFVLTRIRDAGLDYTNRTNYIAHHLILDGLEIAVSPSPSEIFLQWTGWLDMWEGSARWFEDSEMIDLSSCKMPGLCPAQNWQSVTGDGGNAAYLVAEKAKRPILLEVLPGQEEGLLPMFAESCALLSMPMEAWQFSFTTYLQDTDNARDFAWVGGRGQPSTERLKQNGAPNHLNFTAFDQRSIRDPMDEKLTLIAREGRKARIKQPVVTDEAEAAFASDAGAGEGTRIRAGRDVAGFSNTEREQFKQAAASRAASQSTATQTGGDEAQKKKKRPKWPWISALAAVLLLGVFVALKSGALDGIFGKESGGNPVAQKSSGDQGKKTGDPSSPDSEDPLVDGPDPEVDPPLSPFGFKPDVAILASVKDIHPGFEYIVWQVGDSDPVKISLEGITYELGKKLDRLKIGDAMDVTFREGSSPGSFAIAALAPSSVKPILPRPPATLSTTPEKRDFSSQDFNMVSDNFMVEFTSDEGKILRYVFPPDKRARYAELLEYQSTGRKITFRWDEEGDYVRAFDFDVEKVVVPVSPVVTIPVKPPGFDVTTSYAVWLTKFEEEEPVLKSISIQGDPIFVNELKRKLDRIAASLGKSLIWERNYDGPEDLMKTSEKLWSSSYSIKKISVLDFERYTMTSEDGTNALLFRFDFPSSDTVNILFDNEMSRVHVKRGILLRLPDPETNTSMNLYFLSSKVAEKPHGLPKDRLILEDDQVTVIKDGDFKDKGLQVVSSAGSFNLRLSVNPGPGVYYGPKLSAANFMGKDKLAQFPGLWVKPMEGDPLTCDLDLFIEYHSKLKERLLDQISAKQQLVNESAAGKPDRAIFENLEKFGSRVKYKGGNYVPGSGSYGAFLNKVVIDFFQRVHGFDPRGASKTLQEELSQIDPTRLFKGDFEYRDFWQKVCPKIAE
ncbi:MAG: hypothetical protein VB980_04665, partial [Opitutales bacterium]